MLRSMYSGISGLKNFQTKLDVVGNNIANVNTYGFKKGRVTFQDMMYQEVSGAGAPTQARGGINPKQVGLGATIASIDTIHTQGSRQTTLRALDVSLAGDGFFLVGSISDITRVGVDNNGILGNNQIRGAIDQSVALNYTRAGNFGLDENGYLVTANGLYVIGRAGEKRIPTAEDMEVAQEAIDALKTFNDHYSGMKKAGQEMQEIAKEAVEAKKAYDTAVADGDDKEKEIAEKALKTIEAKLTKSIGEYNKNVKEFNTALGNLNKVIETFNEKSGDLSTKVLPIDTLKDIAEGSTLDDYQKMVSDSQHARSFLEQVEKNNNNFKAAAEDFKEYSFSDTLSENAGLIQIPTNAKSYEIGPDGRVTYINSRGQVKVAGQLLVATFANNDGLAKVGDNLFRETTNSGKLDKDGNGIMLDDLSVPGEKGAATMISGSLEMSNVDLSEEFTEMIVAQRGFQANTRIITTSDEILQELVNLKR